MGDGPTAETLGRPATGRSLTGRASLNAVAAGLEYAARALVELLVTPLVVAGVGAAAYGAWRALWQWSGYVWGASGRSAQALQYAVAHRQWTASPAEKRELVGAALVVWLLFTPVVVTAGGIGVWLAPHLLDVPAAQVGPLRIAAIILCLDALAVTVLTLPRSCLVGENLGYTRMGISVGLVALGGGLLVLAVRLDLGLPGIAGSTLLTTLATGLAFWVITRRRLPWFGAARPSRSVTRWLLGLSVWYIGWKLVLELMIASDVLVLAAFAPLAVVAAFVLTKWVADAMAQALSMLTQATIPGIGAYLGSGARDRAASLRGELLSLVWVVGVGVGSTIVVWNESFIGLWVGPRLYAGPAVTLLVVVLALQLALIRADTFVIDVALKPRVKVVAGTIASATSIGLAIVGVGILDAGVTGLCLGLVAGRSVLSIAAPVAVGRFLGVALTSQAAAAVRPLAVTALVLGGSNWAGGHVAATSWIGLLGAVAVTAPLVTVLALVAGLPRRPRGRLVKRARRLLPTRSEASS